MRPVEPKSIGEMSMTITSRSASVVPLTLGLTVVAALALLRSEEGAPAAVTLFFLGGGGLVVLLLTTRTEERRTVAAIFGVGLALRAVTAALVYHWNPGFFSSDQGAYHNQGARLAADWRAEGWPSLDWLATGPGNYFSHTYGLLYYFVGANHLAARMMTSVVGAWGGVRAFRLGREVVGTTEGGWAGWLAACWPSFIIWSAQGLRDALLIWLWCEAGLGVVRVCRGRTSRGLLGLALALYGLTLLRPYGAVLAGMGACLALLIATARGARGAKLVAIGVAGLALLVGGLGFLGSDFLKGKDIETAASIHRGFWGGGSSFAIGADISTYAAAAAYIPLGLAYFLLAPFPWQTGSPLQMSTMLEQPIWYVVFALAVYGVFASVRRRGAEGLVALGAILPGTLFYALVMSNVGTGYRDRAQLVPVFFAYAAQGLVAWRRKRMDRRHRWRTGVCILHS